MLKVNNTEITTLYHRNLGDTSVWGKVDLGTLDYTYRSSLKIFFASHNDVKPVADANIDKGNVISDLYKSVTYKYMSDNIELDKVVALNDNTTNVLRFRNLAYTDAESFKQAMSGVYLWYELSTNTKPTKLELTKLRYNGVEVFSHAPTPATLLSYPHSLGTLSRLTQTGTMTFDRYNISSSPVRFAQNDEDDRAGSVIVNFQPVTPSGTLTSAKLYMYGNGSGNGFLEVDIGNIYVGDFILDTTTQERIINLPTGINPNEPITLTLDEANRFYVDINAMKLELNYEGGRQLMGVKRTTKTQEPSYHRYEKLESEVE